MFQPFTSWDAIPVIIGLVLSYVQDRHEREHKPGRKPKPETVIMRSIGWVVLAVVVEKIVLFFYLN